MKRNPFKNLLRCFVFLLAVYLLLASFFLYYLFEAPDLRVRLIRINEEDVIGLTSLEIEEKYGDFNIYNHITDAKIRGEDGLYRSKKNGYVVKKETSGKWAVWFVIHFDENGVAVEAYERTRPE
ncbi:MAG: hypothetical protein IKC38_02360 [Clostridia bacterium]|nr:hypothetical protein [Clostridia bacterium]